MPSFTVLHCSLYMTHIHAKEQLKATCRVICPLCMRRNIKYQIIFISVGWNMKHTLNTISNYFFFLGGGGRDSAHIISPELNGL